MRVVCCLPRLDHFVSCVPRLKLLLTGFSLSLLSSRISLSSIRVTGLPLIIQYKTQDRCYTFIYLAPSIGTHICEDKTYIYIYMYILYKHRLVYGVCKVPLEEARLSIATRRNTEIYSPPLVRIQLSTLSQFERAFLL